MKKKLNCLICGGLRWFELIYSLAKRRKVWRCTVCGDEVG